MQRELLLLFVVVFFIFSGCVGGVSTDNDGDQSNASDEVCYTDNTRGDPKPTRCLVEEKPPDLLVENRHDEAHDVTVRIIINSTVTYSANTSLAASSDHPTRQILEDVIQTPGEYTIQGTIGSNTSDYHTESLDERYVETANEQWIIGITEDGEIVVDRIRSH